MVATKHSRVRARSTLAQEANRKKLCAVLDARVKVYTSEEIKAYEAARKAKAKVE